MPGKVVVVGSFNMDLTTYMLRMPRPGETVFGDRFVTGPGGKGSNQAVAAARLGAEVTFIGRVGQDEFGQTALNYWKNEGINTDFVARDPELATGVAPIFVDQSGQNSIVVALGANLNIQKADLDAADEVIKNADVLIVQLEINPDMVEYALQKARQYGVKTILNPAPARKLSEIELEKADFLTPNETELEVLSGSSSSDLQEAIAKVRKSKDQTVVVTLGEKGAMFVQDDTSLTVAGYRVEAVDTTGAGDAFNGGLAVGLAEGKTVEEALKFANATAALCVTRYGTAPSMPQRQEVEDFIKQN